MSYKRFGRIKLVWPRHFSLKCLYQARKVRGLFICVRGIEFALFCDFSIGFWNCSDSVVYIFFWGEGHFIWLKLTSQYGGKHISLQRFFLCVFLVNFFLILLLFCCYIPLRCIIYSFHLKSTCDVHLLSKLSIIFKEWRVMNNVDWGGVIVLFVL
jgi:hypothetical protein